MTLLDRIRARNPQPEPDTRPAWLRHGNLARDYTGRVIATDASAIDAADRRWAREQVVAMRNRAA